ncbi:Hypothetical predicted protein [Xyrichtys novacula]|uniref:Uncharacterized protein n=1 Tax=Xyrichtys novacula TaxID=13765 RepID=A0AAV1GAN9_XYRNO|nr:Hypothetical predicted protein [Xyrichtys novacula]
MLTAMMFPVVSLNNRPTQPATQPASLGCVCVFCVCGFVLSHTCVGVRPPLGVSRSVRGSLWGTDPHLSAANGQPPSPGEETLLGFLMEPPPTVGEALRHDFGMTSQECWYPAHQRRVPLERWCKSEAEGENQGGVRGAQPAQNQAASAWDDSTAKHLFPGRTSTSALSHKPIGSANYIVA